MHKEESTAFYEDTKGIFYGGSFLSQSYVKTYSLSHLR